MVTTYSPLTWGIHTEPPPDVPECGFVGELCPASIQGRSSITEDETQYLLVIDHLYFTNNGSTKINQTNKIKYLTNLSTSNNQYPVRHFNKLQHKWRIN